MERNHQRIRFEEAIQVAVVICTITLGMVIAKDKILQVFDSDGLIMIFIVAAFMAVVYWLSSYFFSTRKELSLLADRFTRGERARVKVEDPTMFLAILFGMAFGGAIAFVWNPLIFISFVVFIQVLDLLGNSYINHKIACLVREAVWRDNARDDFLKYLFQYYIVRPHVFRCAVLLMCYLGSLAILLWSNSQVNVPVAYTMFIVAFIIGHVTIKLWRNRRDNDIRSL